MLFFLPFALGLLALIERYEAKIVMKYTLAAFIALLLIGFGHATYLRNFDWKTPEALWSDTIQKSPEISRAYNNLGRFYHDAGHFNKALQLYEEALQRPIASRNDEYFFIYFNLGKVWVELRDYTQAEFFLKQAIHMNPLFGPAYNHLAGVYDKQGKYDLAYQYLLKSFKQFPHDPIINLNLGCYYLRERRFEQAIQHLRQGLYAKQFRTKAVLHLAIAHNQMNRLGKAAVLFQEVITEQPQDIRSYLHLA